MVIAMRTLWGFLLCGGLLVTTAATGAPSVPPVAPVRAVTDDYFGTKVVDPYRWMEDRHDPEFLAWARAAPRRRRHRPARQSRGPRAVTESGPERRPGARAGPRVTSP